MLHDKIEIIRHGVIAQSEHIFGNFNWPSIARLPDGALAVVCSGERFEHIDPFGKVVICYSKDEGKTWTRPATVIDTLLDDRDAGITAWKDKIIVTSFNNTKKFQEYCLEVYNHDDMHKNLFRSYLKYIPEGYEERTLGSMYVISDDGYTFGDIRYAPVMAPHGMTALNDGRLFYAGTLYYSPEEGPKPICYTISEDGLSWSQPVPLPLAKPEQGRGWLDQKKSYFCEPHALCLPSGRILIGLREEVPGKPFNTWVMHSDDGGKTFSEPVLVAAGGAPPHLFRHSSGAVILSYGYRTPPRGQRVRISDDDGETFGSELILRGDAPDWDLGYPATAELTDGSLISVYYQRTDPARRNNSICYTVWKLK